MFCNHQNTLNRVIVTLGQQGHDGTAFHFPRLSTRVLQPHRRYDLKRHGYFSGAYKQAPHLLCLQRILFFAQSICNKVSLPSPLLSNHQRITFFFTIISMASPHCPGKEAEAPEETFIPVVTRHIASEHCCFCDLTIFWCSLRSYSLNFSSNG